MLIDANEGVTDQDAKIAGEAHEAGKGVIIVVTVTVGGNPEFEQLSKGINQMVQSVMK